MRKTMVDVPTEGLDVTRVLVDAEIALRQARAGTTGWAAYDPQPARATRSGSGTGISGLVTGPPSYQPIVRLGTGRVAGLRGLATLTTTVGLGPPNATGRVRTLHLGISCQELPSGSA